MDYPRYYDLDSVEDIDDMIDKLTRIRQLYQGYKITVGVINGQFQVEIEESK